jgi:hypothetical protein
MFASGVPARPGGAWGDEFHGGLVTPDTPDFINFLPDLGPYFAYGSGTGVFTPERKV